MESTRTKEIILFCLLVFVATCHTFFDSSESQIGIDRRYLFIKDGDIIFRNGKSFVSGIARNASVNEKKFSHVGIVVKNKIGFEVIHTIEDSKKNFDGVIVESIRDYLLGIDDWAIYRVEINGISGNEIGQIAKAMSKSKISFDYDFDLTTAERQYCTEFVANVINEAVGDDIILPRSKRLGKIFISIEDVYNNSGIIRIYEAEKI